MASTYRPFALALSLTLFSLSVVAENLNRNDYPPLNEKYEYTVGDTVYTIRYERDADNGAVRTQAYDSNGEHIEYKDLPLPNRPLISEDLKQSLEKAVTTDRVDKNHRVIVALNSPNIPIETPTSSSMREQKLSDRPYLTVVAFAWKGLTQLNER
ncbi:hypothetical protein [Marinimicrobium sp. C2-29]|uniref:hypothetical protein n=1 Tax=Marinimicrobium sp. C2-29 TaxID=3139825 RepID=UPI0031391A3B